MKAKCKDEKIPYDSVGFIFLNCKISERNTVNLFPWECIVKLHKNVMCIDQITL